MSRRRPWTRAFGAYGHKVTVCEQSGSTRLYLRWWDHDRDNWRWRSLGHADRTQGEQQARELAATLLVTQEADRKRRLTVGDLFARFERDVVAYERPTLAQEDRRRMALWTRALGAERDVATVDRSTLDRFVRARSAGQLEVPGYHLRANPSDRTIGADLEHLRRICNWARSVCRADGSPLLERNPVIGYAIPTTVNPKRPVATYDRYLAVRAKADDADPQRLFGPFLDLIEGLG